MLENSHNPRIRLPVFGKYEPKWYTYFIQGDLTRLIKIGRAVDVEKRMAALQTGSPDKLRLLGITRESEAKLHIRFRRHRAHGEWFLPEPDLLRYISTSCEIPA